MRTAKRMLIDIAMFIEDPEDVAQMSREEIRQYLIEEGIDVEALHSRLEEIIRKCKEAMKL